MSVFESQNFDDHEGVHFFSDADIGFKAIISVHNTARGPGAGGTRLWTYDTSQAALDDALNLSRAMSYKNAMADIPFGGGKGVIMRPEGKFDREALFVAYGKAVESLGGVYCTAEDVGVSTADMEIVRTQTRYVAGLDSGRAASGDPSPVTAEGVFRGLHVAAETALRQSDLKDVRVAVQGLGHVGYSLCQKLYSAGAKLYVADINKAAVAKAEQELNAVVVDPNKIHAQEVDIFAPCALGGSVNAKTINEIKARVVGGAANNQLADSTMGGELKARDILYCPDYVINGGGIINVAAELSGEYQPEWVDEKLNGLCKTLNEIFSLSVIEQRPTNTIADRLAVERIQAAA